MQNLVAGPWGDLSQDFHILLSSFAKSRAEASARSNGSEGGSGAGELGKIMGEIRTAMSVQVVRSQALCLLERLSRWLIWVQGQGQLGRGGRWCRGLKKPGRDKHRHTDLPTETEDSA